MSGVSLAVAPRSEPDQTINPSQQQPQTLRTQRQQQQSVMGGVMGSLRVIELQLVAFIMVFSVSGLVPLFDLAFPAFASVYLIALSRFAFPSTRGRVTTGSQEIFRGSAWFRVYVAVGTTIGLFLPLAYVLGGFARGDDHAVRSATPHLFLLSFQILTENLISGFSLFSPPVRALVPVLYTVRRLFVILDWVLDVWFNKPMSTNLESKDVWLNKPMPPNVEFKDGAWWWFGKVLSVVNLMYFSINLFCFLIPRFLPRAFERYFTDRNEVHAKMAEDKHLSANRSDTEPTGKKSN